MPELKLHARALALAPSATLAMKAKAKSLRDEGVDVVDLTAGEPDFGTPKPIIEAAKRALDEGATRYTPVRGTDALLDAIQAKLKRDQGIDVQKGDILQTAGAKAAIALALNALVGEGDEVIIVAPYWVSYPEQIKLAGATPVVVSSTPASGYVPDAADIKAAITERTRAVILNSPSNPTGAVWPEDTLRSVMALFENTEIAVISDEIYEHLVYDGQKHVCPASFNDDAFSRTLVISGVSKGYAMTGWRLGFAAGPSHWVGAMAKIQGQIYTATASVTQAASAFAFQENDAVRAAIDEMRAAYVGRRNRLMDLVAEIPGLKAARPGGAFYAFLDFSEFIGKELGGEIIRDDLHLAELLLLKGHVAVVPGTPFGAPGGARVSIASSLERIEEGMARIKKVLAG
jgi:aspartate aminotransferase